MLKNGSGRRQWSLPHTQTTQRLWHKLTKERKFIDTAAPLSQPKHVLCNAQLKEVTCTFWFPKQPKLPGQTLNACWWASCGVPSWTQTGQVPHPSVWSSCALWWEEQPEHKLLLFRAWEWDGVSVVWALITLWKLWDSPALKARIFTGNRGSRVEHPAPWSCSEHHPNWLLKFYPKLHPLGHW